MTIRTQKILSFIPIVNMICVFCLLGMISKERLTLKYLIKPLLKCWIVVFVGAFGLIICKMIDVRLLVMIIEWLIRYLFFFFVAQICLKQQEKYYKNKEEETGDDLKPLNK